MSAGPGTRVVLPAPAPHRARRPEPGLTERLLLAIGADARFVEDVLGDLAEERAERRMRRGRLRADAWYLAEAARAVPHLVWSAAMHGTPRARMRLAAFCGATGLAAAAGIAVWATRAGPPARLTVGDGPDLTINNLGPVRLDARVVDAGGRVLHGTSVQYRWAGGAPARVSADGVMQCTKAGDSRVRASAGHVSTEVVVHCDPVDMVLLGQPSFFEDDAPRPLPIVARDAQGHEVRRLAGQVRVADSTVATVLPDGRVVPRHAGQTHVQVTIGDVTNSTRLTVFERVKSFVGLRPDQRFVVAPVHLEPGEVIRWPLPPGSISLSLDTGAAEPNRDAATLSRIGDAGVSVPPFVMFVEGPIMCMPDLGPGVPSTGCIVRSPEARLVIAHPGRSFSGPVSGAVSLQVFETGYPPAASRRAMAGEKH